MVGKDAPLFQARLADGSDFRFQTELKSNKYVMVNFWGVRCGACIQEIPSLEEMFGKYSGQGFSVVGINVDGLDSETLSEQMKTLGLKMKYKVVADPELKIGDLFNMTGAPLTYIVSAEGKIVYQHAGYEEGDEVGMEKFVATLFPGR